MISFAKHSVSNESRYQDFLVMLPAIRRHAQLAFRGLDPVERDELVAEVVADAFVAYRRLSELGKRELAYATPLAMYAVRHVRSGRRVGTPVNKRDVLSPANRRVTVQPLQHFDQGDGEWKEVLVEDKHAGPAETAAARLDVAKWFRKLPLTKRRIARVLAGGETTLATARRFGLTAGRVSQLRRELQASWRELQGEPVAA